MKNEKSVIGFASTFDTGWYFSATSLIFNWARIIGPTAFLVLHAIKSQCPERGLKGRPIDWSEAASLIGLNESQIEDGLNTLKTAGLLTVDKEDCLVVQDPDEAFINYGKQRGTQP